MLAHAHARNIASVRQSDAFPHDMCTKPLTERIARCVSTDARSVSGDAYADVKAPKLTLLGEGLTEEASVTNAQEQSPTVAGWLRVPGQRWRLVAEGEET